MKQAPGSLGRVRPRPDVRGYGLQREAIEAVHDLVRDVAGPDATMIVQGLTRIDRREVLFAVHLPMYPDDVFVLELEDRLLGPAELVDAVTPFVRELRDALNDPIRIMQLVQVG